MCGYWAGGWKGPVAVLVVVLSSPGSSAWLAHEYFGMILGFCLIVRLGAVDTKSS